MGNRTDSDVAALRATIRERGTARMALVPVIFIGWAAASIATAAAIGIAIASIVPLIVLVAGFETIFSLHMNVERIRQHLHALADGDAPPSAGAATTPLAGVRPDPLFGRLFILATSVNFIPIALRFEYAAELALMTVPHFLLINRIRVARKAASACSDPMTWCQ